MEALFSRMIKCLDCEKTHKTKLIRGKSRIYICSTYDNYGKSKCSRNKVDQDYLIQLLQMRFKKEPIDEIITKVEYVLANESIIEIHLKQGNGEPIISSERFAQF